MACRATSSVAHACTGTHPRHGVGRTKRACEEITARTPPYLEKRVSPQFQVFNKLPNKEQEENYKSSTIQNCLKAVLRRKCQKNKKQLNSQRKKDLLWEEQS